MAATIEAPTTRRRSLLRELPKTDYRTQKPSSENANYRAGPFEVGLTRITVYRAATSGKSRGYAGPPCLVDSAPSFGHREFLSIVSDYDAFPKPQMSGPLPKCANNGPIFDLVLASVPSTQ
jgi:hypothetical protein